MYNSNDYQANYENLEFENHLRIYRMKHVTNYIHSVKSDKILEIGSGSWPLFEFFNAYEVLDIVEPGEYFYKTTKNKASNNDRVSVTHGLIEEVYPTLSNDYDIILIGGFLHEIENPKEVLEVIKKIAKKETIVISYVPNADSFHRLLAFEAGIINSKYQYSKNDVLFGRRSVFNKDSFSAIFEESSFSILNIDTYFIKAFTNEQMEHLMNVSFLNERLLTGFSKMIEYMPDMGAEIFLAARILD